MVNWLCGVEGMQDQREPVYTEEEAEEIRHEQERQMSTHEEHRSKIIVNILLVLTMSATIFIWAFFY